jgi:hypothetical protein
MEPIPNILHFRDELISFLTSIGLSYPPSNRFEESFKEVERALENEVNKSRDFSKEAHMRHALAELTELKFILKSIQKMNISENILKEKFKIILSGERPVNKKSMSLNDESRNTVFELAMASYIQEKGLSTQYEVGNDIYLETDGSRIGIECKRINGDPRKSLKHLLRKAHKQLLRRKEHIDFGVIAINVDTAFFSEGKMLVSVDGKSASEGFYSMLKEFISKNGDLWQRRKIINSQEFVPAVFICLSGTAYAIGTNETANGFFVLVNNTSTPTSNNFEKIKAISPKLQSEYML